MERCPEKYWREIRMEASQLEQVDFRLLSSRVARSSVWL